MEIGAMFLMTYAERSALRRLAEKDQTDHDTRIERYLVGSGYAHRIPGGMLTITKAGAALLEGDRGE